MNISKTSLGQILFVASMGWGKGWLGFGADWIKTGCHGNQKIPLTYNGVNDSSTFSQ